MGGGREGSRSTIRIALDWHPNTNHCGIFVALAKGFFNEQNVDVEIISAATIYDEKNKNNDCDFPSTPAGYVLSGAADLAICPSETVISHYNYNNDSNEDDNRKSSLVAVATLLERDTSAIVTLKSSNISRPRELDNHAYGSYAARYEGRIVQALIQSDGGEGKFEEKCPEKLGIWETLVKGNCDATWVFMNWEGIAAKKQGLDLNAFLLEEYGINYGYTPILVANSKIINNNSFSVKEQRDQISRFLKATSKGYEYCCEHPREAAKLFIEYVNKNNNGDMKLEFEDDIIYESFVYTAPFIKRNSNDGDNNWGYMTEKKWDDFLDWLDNKDILTTYKQSRKPTIISSGETNVHNTSETVSLDDLRSGKAGNKIERSKYDSKKMFTNDLLP